MQSTDTDQVVEVRGSRKGKDKVRARHLLPNASCSCSAAEIYGLRNHLHARNDIAGFAQVPNRRPAGYVSLKLKH